MGSTDSPIWRGGAVFDGTGQYRYSLWRTWRDDQPRIVFIMLNPSTADAERNDPTIRRCMAFAHAWGYGSLEVVNLFAYRATDVRELSAAMHPVGPENDRFMREALTRCAEVVVAWGVKGTLHGRNREVISMLADEQGEKGKWTKRAEPGVYCLGTTKEGHPHHPLYLSREAALRPFTLKGKTL